MDLIWGKFTEWLKEMLVSGIMDNLNGMFNYVNGRVAEIAGQVGATPQGWNSGIYNMIRTLSDNVILPIAGVILAFVMTLELIQLITEKNNMHDVDTWMFFKWIFKTACAVLIVTNTWNIVMGVFEAAQIERDNYTAVYAGELKTAGDTQDRLNGLYQTFNIDHPEDFCGHSLSVSDIVALRQNGVVSCHYVDSWGFKELPSFLKPENYLKNAEMAMEDDYGMIDGIVNNGPKKTAAEIEAEAMSGKPVSLLSYVEALRREQQEQEQKEVPKPEKKPSVLAKLQAPVSEPKKTARSKSAEREM